jgi:hypothetical protein
MKIKWVLIVYAVVSVLALMLLLSRENVFVVAALVIGFILLGHRELWSLVRHRRLPVIDERVRTNLTSAFRLTAIFFFIASVVLILLLHFNVFKNVPASVLVSALLVIVGLIYVITYHFYDRVYPSLGVRAVRWLKICLIIAGFSVSTIALSIVLHNLVSSWIGFDEGFFFVLGLLVAPAVLAISLLGSLGIYINGLILSVKQGKIQ